MKNIIYEVRVTNFEKSSMNVPGFASISKFSNYFAEQEILFNPLNYFHILEVKTTILKKNGEEDKTFYEILFGFGSKRNVELKDHEQLWTNKIISDIAFILIFHTKDEICDFYIKYKLLKLL